MLTIDDEKWMSQAIALAKRGEFTARPNPCVGALIVKDGVIVGEGLHWQAGLAHAEVNALKQAKDQARGATCYVTLEPCCHQGRTPPCVNALIEAGVSRVVIASLDPNPLMQGKGMQALQAAGIDVTQGVLAQAAQALNVGFFSSMVRQRPFVRAKIAISLDGKIALKNGQSQWITDAPAREDGHLWRARSGAIVTTVQTVLNDDCKLTARVQLPTLPQEVSFKQPMRVVLDKDLQISTTAAILHQAGRCVVMIADGISLERQQTFLTQVNNQAVQLQTIALLNQHLNFSAVLQWLQQQDIHDVFIEAGAHFLGALVQAGFLDEWIVYMAPKLLGHEGLSMAVIPGIDNLNQHINGRFTELRHIGSDLCVQMRFDSQPNSQEGLL